MNRIGLVLMSAALAALNPAPRLHAQQVKVTSARTAVFFESYSFDRGLPFTDVEEVTIPVGVDVALTRFLNLSISTGWARAEITGSPESGLGTQSISGALDTELRFSYDVVPGRLVLIAMSALPTGTETIRNEEAQVLGAITSDVIGFSSSNLGSGGNAGGGFAAAIPVGRFAVGIGATFSQPLSFEPVLGDPRNLRPGSEVKIRSGFQGPLARRTYIRIAGIFAHRDKDEIGDVTQNGVGNRWVGYVSLNQGIGRANATLYGFDVFRADPQIEATAQGNALLPRGNLFAFGARAEVPVASGTSINPRIEYRYSQQAMDVVNTNLEKFGSSLRFELDVRQRLDRRFAVVFQGSGITGDVVQAGREVNFDGYRVAVHLEVSP